MTKGIPPIRRYTLRDKAQDKYDKINKKSYTLLIGIGMIVNSNYIGTSLSVLIQEVIL